MFRFRDAHGAPEWIAGALAVPPVSTPWRR
jgi:hypothetical protein